MVSTPTSSASGEKKDAQLHAASAAHSSRGGGEIAPLRAFLSEELANLSSGATREKAVQERRLRKLHSKRDKLLDAHFADAIPLDLLKREQTRISSELASVEARLADLTGDFETAERNLQGAISLAGDCHHSALSTTSRYLHARDAAEQAQTFTKVVQPATSEVVAEAA